MYIQTKIQRILFILFYKFFEKEKKEKNKNKNKKEADGIMQPSF